MQLYIKTFPDHFSVCDPSGALVGTIRKKLSPRSLVVCGPDGRESARIRQRDEALYISRGGVETGPYPLVHAPEQGLAPRAPLAVRVVIQSPRGPVTICQQDDRTFHVQQEGREVCTVTHILDRHKELRCEDGGFSALYQMVLFAVCLFMLHDDDLTVV